MAGDHLGHGGSVDGAALGKGRQGNGGCEDQGKRGPHRVSLVTACPASKDGTTAKVKVRGTSHCRWRVIGFGIDGGLEDHRPKYWISVAFCSRKDRFFPRPLVDPAKGAE
jgi:hypothetical protein